MRNAECGTRSRDWTPRSDKPRRSVFSNFKSEIAARPDNAASLLIRPPGGAGAEQVRDGLPVTGATDSSAVGSLQSAIDTAIARSFIYRFLAKAFEDPDRENWSWLTDSQTHVSLRLAVQAAGSPSSALVRSLEPLISALTPDAFASFHSAYLAAFGHAARGRCPLNEIEYGDIKADPLFQPHRLADLAAFYRAFGLEVAEDADERHDHICLELEFMTVLVMKEAYGLEHQLDADEVALGREAQRGFLREHLGRWTPAFARRLASSAADPALGALANLVRAFIETECTRFGLTPGSEDLLLRPVDEAVESACASCGLAQLPPGAVASPGAVQRVEAQV